MPVRSNPWTWVDPQARRRRHSLMPADVAQNVPELYATQEVNAGQDAILQVKLFHTHSALAWYIIEMGDAGQCYGLVESMETEFGYFHLNDLARLNFGGFIPSVQRDLRWTPCPASERP